MRGFQEWTVADISINNMNKYLYNNILYILAPGIYRQEKMQHFFNPFMMKGLSAYAFNTYL